jgi:multisubunit Na+/H+ antiporter MnhE subunit
MARALLVIATLTLVYALAIGSFAPWDLLLGAAVSAVLVAGLGPAVLGRAPVRAGLVRRMVGFPSFVGVTLLDMTVGTWQVASVVLGLRPLRRPGIVEIPIGERSDSGALFTAFAATLAPGEFLVDIDWDREVLLFHVLDASDPDRVRGRFAEIYRDHQQRVFP